MKIPHTHEVDGEIMHEFKRVTVELAYKDGRYAIIKKGANVSKYATYALTGAHFLNLAYKQSASGGGGHGHSHAH